ncbi:FecR family protein [Chitinophaga ginsengisegetis]|uniref:FecR family protein n=1 Tax=Chitinophaga ginsengisegetis TaxID=393003 RepID=A0A1T5N7F6_9BACT|nr:FecR family protein [Chitinophaga ginsengisegetis]SKC95958.1 FecR family protein [Chitinophaga ginsengisegetis]
MDEPKSNALFIAGLLSKHLKGNLTPEEASELQAWIADNEQRRQLWDDINDAGVQQVALKLIAQYNENEALEHFLARHSPHTQPAPEQRIPFLQRWKWAAAAAAIIFMAGALYWFQSQRQAPTGFTNNAPVTDISPGKNGAILKLADGSSIALDSLANGVVATQNGTPIVLDNGALVYGRGGNKNNEIAYNIITTPNGRQFRVALPDGTQVWLNAASSIRYPTVFDGKHRNVEITGEVYFEVAPDARTPFQVTVLNNARIEVLGTHFNVNAYANEESQHTTLLEGAVKVISLKEHASDLSRKGIVLRPGQQLQLSEIPRVIDNADIDKIMAWKNGLFDFDGMDLKYAMKQIARWYDVEIVYRGTVPDIKFYGKISRNISLAGLIKGLNSTGVHLNIEEGKRLVVTQ